MRSFFKKLISRRVVIAAAACLVLSLMTGLRTVSPDFLTSIRELTFDYYQRVKPRDYDPVPVRIVDIDEASIAEIGQWPWPRTRLAEMVNMLTDLGAAVIVFDVVFAEPDRTSPAQMRRSLPPTTNTAILNTLKMLPDHDMEFARSISKAPVVLGFAIATDENGRDSKKKAGIAFAGENPVNFLPPFTAALPSLDILQEVASGLGSISISQDDHGGVVRRVPLIVSNGTEIFPSLTTEALRVAQGASGLIIRSTGSSTEADTGMAAVTDVKIGAFTAPTTGSGELWIYYTPEQPDRYVPVMELLDRGNMQNIRPLIEGQIVLIGTSAAGLRDIRATSLGELVPGVSVHAQALEQIINEDFLARPDWANGFEILVTFIIGASVILALPAIGSVGTALLGATIAASLVGGSFYLFLEKGLLIDPIYPSMASFLVFAAATALLYFLTEREKRFVRQAFSQYLSPDLVTQLENSPEQLALGGEIRPMTILFMDIRGFTPISEQLSPTELVNFLNTLLSPLSDAIQAEGGTIDKYIGDSIMAFWNAPLSVPDHAERACRASIAMLRVVDELNARDAFHFKARGLKTQTVRIGIGLNSGDACVGNMGSARRFNYSVIGDAVNISSRIESSCKAVGAELLVSNETRQQAPGLAYLEAGEVPLKGKDEPVKLFALLGDEAFRSTDAFQKLETVHQRLVAAIRDNDPETAARDLAQARDLDPSLQGFYDRFDGLINALKSTQETSSAAQTGGAVKSESLNVI